MDRKGLYYELYMAQGEKESERQAGDTTTD